MGTAILRRYVVLGPIGRGGVSVVYQAIDAQSARQRALKLVAPAFAGDPGAWDRVRREAEITERLRHPSVPRVYDCGDAPLPDGSVVPYVVMELLSGVVLAGRLVGGALPWAEAVSTAATIADVLAVAHRRGVVHRDLAPENVMLTRAGVKIIDFGLAATLDGRGDRGPAQPRSGPPTPAGHPADDVYALGVLLYQMLTGRSPYPAADPDLALSASRRRTVAPTPVLVVPGMPREVADICRDCMAKRPADRPDASSVAIALWSMLMPVPEVEPLFHPADR
jgi:serine/threonine-protein kinase